MGFQIGHRPPMERNSIHHFFDAMNPVLRINPFGEVLKMNVELKQVAVDEKEILRNLLEKYDYEFSQWDKRDVNKLGLYGYDYLDNYWTEEKRWAYFIMVDGKLAGFAMVITLPVVNDRETDFQMAEFL